MKRVLTGLQPSGALTIGNYIGSIRQMVNYQNEYDSFIFIADMHAITVPQDSKELSKNIRELLAIYLACGIDPNKNTIYLQSDNIYHANASWILECMTPYGELSRMTQFKDKMSHRENFSAGLLTYPVLMASDILLYDADYVPVGKDQKQHVEFARNTAERVNKKYDKEIFKLKGYVDESNKENINNIIYNSVLKDKNEELSKIEKEFYYKKDYALSTYKERGENLKDIFKNEISKCLKNIKKEISSQFKQTKK